MLPRREILAMTLLAAALGAWISMLPSTMNYLQYYSALENLVVKVSSMVITSGSSNVTVSIRFYIGNPTPYLGIRFATLAYQALLPNGTDTLVIWAGAESSQVPSLLSANSSLTLNEDFVMSGLRWQQYDQLSRVGNGILNWTIRGSLGLDTRDGDLTHQFEIPFTTTRQ